MDNSCWWKQHLIESMEELETKTFSEKCPWSVLTGIRVIYNRRRHSVPSYTHTPHTHTVAQSPAKKAEAFLYHIKHRLLSTDSEVLFFSHLSWEVIRFDRTGHARGHSQRGIPYNVLSSGGTFSFSRCHVSKYNGPTSYLKVRF